MPETNPTSSNVTRRSFIQSTAAIAASTFAAPAILHADDKAGSKPIRLGKDDYTFELVPGWGELPEGKKFGNTHAVVEAEDGRIFVHNASPTGDATCVFDADGKFIKSWGKQFAAGAHGMDIRKEGDQQFLYLAPTGMHKFYKTTLDGEIVWEQSYPKLATDVRDGKTFADYQETESVDKKGAKHTKKADDWFVPTFTALAPNGDFYVTDGYGSSFVHRFNLKGEYIQSWGGSGKDPGVQPGLKDAGRMNCPHGIWCDTRDAQNPVIVVADRGNVRLQWFTLDGKFIKMKTDDLRGPCHFSQRGDDLLIPDLQGRVTIIGKDNQLITHLGDNPNVKQRGNNGVKQADTTPGIFCTPHGATWDHAGNAYVVEWLPYGRVSKLKRVTA